jgi:hypothetical protein
VGYIDPSSGKYHKGPLPMDMVVPTKTSVWKGSDHDRQRADHKKDLIPPRLKNGDWNPEFLEAYPEEAKDLWGWEPPETEDLRSTL